MIGAPAFPEAPEIAFTKNKIYYLANNQEFMATFTIARTRKSALVVYS
jgi:hypothetical protein